MVYNPCPDGFKLVGGVCVPQSNEALMKWKSRQGKKRQPQPEPEPEPDIDPEPEPDLEPERDAEPEPDVEPDVEPEPDPEFWDNLNEAIAKDKEKEEAEAAVGLVSTTAGLTSVGYGVTKKAQRAMRQQNKQKIDEVTEDDAVEDIELTERQSMNLFEDVAEEEEAGEEDAFLGGQTGTEMTGLRQRGAGTGTAEESTLLEEETEEMVIGDEIAEEEMFLTTEELLSIGGGAGLIVGGLYIGAYLIDSDFGKIQPIQSQEEAEMSGRDNVEVAQESMNSIGNIFGD